MDPTDASTEKPTLNDLLKEAAAYRFDCELCGPEAHIETFRAIGMEQDDRPRRTMGGYLKRQVPGLFPPLMAWLLERNTPKSRAFARALLDALDGRQNAAIERTLQVYARSLDEHQKNGWNLHIQP